jgi:CxxC motif-containing protein (DUF1111 family)
VIAMRNALSWVLFASTLVGCGGEPLAPNSGLAAETGEELVGGETTVFDTSPNAFSLSSRNMTPERRSTFFVGNSFFKENWVIAPASTEARDGLGPLYNARSCSGCHLLDGRGSPPEDVKEALTSVLVRLSVPGQTEHGGPMPEAIYGGQLQPKAIPGVTPEGDAFVSYEDVPGAFVDGETYQLRRPKYSLTLGRGDMDPTVMLSPRAAPQMIGLGLLEAIPEETIVAAADPDDADGDGISGRPNRVWDVVLQQMALGRFGWKANQPNLTQQTAGAFLGDMGISTSLFNKQECTTLETDCAGAPDGGAPECSEHIRDSVTFYSMTLAPPARRDWQDPEVLQGKQLFAKAGCAKCHTPKFETGTLEGFAELSGQTIWPYTDLLVHDMGDELADGRPDFDADGKEWRTPPLWGVGLIAVVNGHMNLLHDGRARGVSEAILWHGGEAEMSREAYRALSLEERRALVRFVESL